MHLFGFVQVATSSWLYRVFADPQCGRTSSPTGTRIVNSELCRRLLPGILLFQK